MKASTELCLPAGITWTADIAMTSRVAAHRIAFILIECVALAATVLDKLTELRSAFIGPHEQQLSAIKAIRVFATSSQFDYAQCITYVIIESNTLLLDMLTGISIAQFIHCIIYLFIYIFIYLYIYIYIPIFTI